MVVGGLNCSSKGGDVFIIDVVTSTCSLHHIINDLYWPHTLPVLGYRQVSASRAVRRKQSELTQQERAAQRHVPLELLASEWLTEQRAGFDTRAYLAENLLPTLVLGAEKLLTEVSLRGIAECEETQPDFNPVNYLAQYLMRNNPRYSNFAEAHPYCRTMHEVTEKLKRMAVSVDENKLAGLKAHMRQRREERERREAVQTQEEGRRESVLKEVFTRWSPEGKEEVCLRQVGGTLLLHTCTPPAFLVKHSC